MNAMILLAQGAMNMADSLATANPVLTEVGTPEMNMLDMAIKGGWIMVVLGVLSVVCFYILFERNYMIRKAGKEDPDRGRDIGYRSKASSVSRGRANTISLSRRMVSACSRWLLAWARMRS